MLADASLGRRLADQGLDPAPGSPAELTAYTEVSVWGQNDGKSTKRNVTADVSLWPEATPLQARPIFQIADLDRMLNSDPYRPISLI